MHGTLEAKVGIELAEHFSYETPLLIWIEIAFHTPNHTPTSAQNSPLDPFRRLVGLGNSLADRACLEPPGASDCMNLTLVIDPGATESGG